MNRRDLRPTPSRGFANALEAPESGLTNRIRHMHRRYALPGPPTQDAGTVGCIRSTWNRLLSMNLHSFPAERRPLPATLVGSRFGDRQRCARGPGQHTARRTSPSAITRSRCPRWFLAVASLGTEFGERPLRNVSTAALSSRRHAGTTAVHVDASLGSGGCPGSSRRRAVLSEHTLPNQAHTPSNPTAAKHWLSADCMPLRGCPSSSECRGSRAVLDRSWLRSANFWK